MTTLRQDLRSAFRQARRAPGLTALIAGSVALGIATCTILFCLIWALELRPLPFRAPRDLYGFSGMPPVQPAGPEPASRVSYPDYLDLRAQSRPFAEVEAFFGNYGLTLTGGTPERIRGTLVSAGLLDLLGARPFLGRQIRPEEDRSDAEGAVLLGYGLWQRRFGGDPAILGKVIEANSSRYRVLGVMPPGFSFPGDNEAWVALGPETAAAAARSVRRFLVLARLRPGVSAAAAQGRLDAIGKRLAALYPEDAGWTFTVAPLRPWLLENDLRRSVLALLAAVLAVLLIACANISSLLLAQGEKRRREMVLRAALGASPGRLVRQLLTESLALAAAGGALGIPLGIAGLQLLGGALPPLPYGFALRPDLPPVAAALAVSLAAGLLFGLAPARRAARPDLGGAFQHAAAGGSRGGGRLHAVLVVAEVALATVLLITASLSIRTLSALRSGGASSAPERVLTAWTSLSSARYQAPESRAAGLRVIAESLAALPGIESAAATNFVPLAVVNGLPVQVEAVGNEPANPSEPAERQLALCSAVTSGFFRTWGLPLLAGRDLTAAEGSTESSAAVISEALAHGLWPREPAARVVGRSFRFTTVFGPEPRTVVGVAADFKIGNLREGPRPQVFLPAPYNFFRPAALLMRTRLPPQEAAAAVRQVLRRIDPDLPLDTIATMEEISAAQLRTERLSGAGLAVFGAIALLFAATGTYAILAVGVARRRREIAVRLALGAPRGALFRRLVGRGIGLALLGLSLGLLLALLLSRAPGSPVVRRLRRRPVQLCRRLPPPPRCRLRRLLPAGPAGARDRSRRSAAGGIAGAAPSPDPAPQPGLHARRSRLASPRAGRGDADLRARRSDPAPPSPLPRRGAPGRGAGVPPGESRRLQLRVAP